MTDEQALRLLGEDAGVEKGPSKGGANEGMEPNVLR
jgi:hypothetical protein